MAKEDITAALTDMINDTDTNIHNLQEEMNDLCLNMESLKTTISAQQIRRDAIVDAMRAVENNYYVRSAKPDVDEPVEV